MAAIANSTLAKGGNAITSLVTSGFTSTTGNAVFVCIHAAEASTISTVTDNKGNTYTQLGVIQSTLWGDANVYYVNNAAGGTNHTCTVTWTAATDVPVVIFAEATGVISAAMDTGSLGQITDGTSPFTVTSGPLVQANSLVISFCAFRSLENPATYVESTGFTTVQEERDNSVYYGSAVATKFVTQTAALTPSWTSVNALETAQFVFALRASAAAVGVTSNRTPVKRRRATSTFDYTSGGWFHAQVAAAGSFDKDLLYPASTGGTAGVAQAASQAEGGVVLVLTAVAQAAAQACGGTTVVANGVAQAAAQAIGGSIFVASGAGQTASQASGVGLTVALGVAQSASQAAGNAVNVAAGASQSASQAIGGVVDVSAGVAQAAAQAAGSVVAVVAGVAQSASQAVGASTSGTTVVTAGVAQSASQAAGNVTNVSGGVAQAAAQATAGTVVVTAGVAQSASQAAGPGTSGTTVVAAGAAQSASQAAGAVVEVVAGAAQAAAQAHVGSVAVAAGNAQSASQAARGSVVVAAGSATGQSPAVASIVIVVPGVSMSYSQVSSTSVPPVVFGSLVGRERTLFASRNEQQTSTRGNSQASARSNSQASTRSNSQISTR